MAKPTTLLPLLLVLSATLALSHNSGNDPFFFDEESFRTLLRTQQGSVRILERFSKLSDSLIGIDNYRLVILEANPYTAISPHYFDATEVLIVLRGSATITLIRNENRESYNLRRGDVFRLHAGTTVWIVNRDKKEKLFVAKLSKTISTQGQLHEFFGIGGQNPKSFCLSFSSNILEAAFNTPFTEVERLFGEMKNGALFSLPEEKIKEIAQQASSSSEGGRFLVGEPFNLFEKRPTYSNQHGELYEIDSSDYADLQDIDISVSFRACLGSMLAPQYSNRGTKVALVVAGSGYVEIASPNLCNSSGEQRNEQEESISYKRHSAQVKHGQVFAVLAGYPFVIVADQGQDLQLVFFEINTKNIKRYLLAGRGNVFNKMNKAEKELFFNVTEREVNRVLNSQYQLFFIDGPRGRKDRESEDLVLSKFNV